MKIEESLNQDNIEQEFNDESDYLSDLEDYYPYYENNNINDEPNSTKKFNIYFHFAFNKEKKYLLHICHNSFIINDIHIYELIEFIIKKINEKNICIKYNDIDYSISLKDIEENVENEKFDFYTNNYEIKPLDFMTTNNTPSYYPISLLKSIDEENIILLSKSELNIMIMKNF